MSQKHFNINTFIAILTITAVVAGWGIIYFGAKDTPYNYNASHLVVGRDDAKIHAECDKEMQEQSYIIDSLYERTIELETKVAGYELADHSKITNYAAAK